MLKRLRLVWQRQKSKVSSICNTAKPALVAGFVFVYPVIYIKEDWVMTKLTMVVKDKESKTSSWRNTKQCSRCNWMSLKPFGGFVCANPYVDSHKANDTICPECGCEAYPIVAQVVVDSFIEHYRKSWFFGLVYDDWSVYKKRHVSTTWRWLGSHPDENKTIQHPESEGHSEYRNNYGW